MARDDRIVFRAALGRDALIRAEAVAPSPATFEVHVRRGETDDLIARGTGTAKIAGRLPRGSAEIELVSRGPVTWADPRLERTVPIKGPAALLARTNATMREATSSPSLFNWLQMELCVRPGI